MDSLPRGESLIGVAGRDGVVGEGGLTFPLTGVLGSWGLFTLSVCDEEFSFITAASFSTFLACADAAGTSLLGAGVGPEPAGLLLFFLVLRARIGATSSTVSLGVMMAAISASLSSFSFLLFLLVVSFLTCRLTMLGGGELARDTEAEVTEKASTRSLTGVPGGIVEVMLGRLEACLLAPAVAAAINGIAGAGVGSAGGVSARGVSVIRNVLG